MKSKNAPQTLKRRLLKYLPLLFACGVLGLWIGWLEYISRFPNSYDKAVLYYPLIQFADNLIQPWAVVCALIMILHGVTIGAGGSKIMAVLSFLILSGIASFWLFIGTLQVAPLKQYDTLSTEGHLYRLVYLTNGEIWGYSSPIEAYTVLECDVSGTWCSYYSTPYLKEQSYKSDYPKDAQLELDPITHHLLLSLNQGQDVIDVEEIDIFKICHEIYEDYRQSDRNQNIDLQGYVCG